MQKYNDVKKLHRKFAAQVRAENAKFSKATDAERRVIIAKDVLHHLRVGLVVTTAGEGYGYFEALEKRGNARSVQKWLREDAVVCQACVRGTLVYSAVLRRGGVRGLELNGDKIPEEFSKKMMLEIEAAFESNSDFLFDNPLDSYWREFDVPILESLAEWHRAWMTKSATSPAYVGRPHYTRARRIRMTAIMQWIVDHDGEFSIVDFLRTMAETDAIEAAIREVEEAGQFVLETHCGSGKYLVNVCRKEYRTHQFEVEADSPEEAEELAIEDSYNHDFRQDAVCHADAEVILVERVKPA